MSRNWLKIKPGLKWLNVLAVLKKPKAQPAESETASVSPVAVASGAELSQETVVEMPEAPAEPKKPKAKLEIKPGLKWLNVLAVLKNLKVQPAEESWEEDWKPPIDPEKSLATYAVQPPYAHVAIEATQPPTYAVYEVELTPGETELLKEIKMRLYELIDVDFTLLEKAEEFLKTKVEWICRELGIQLSPRSLARIMYYVARDLIGYGRLDPILRDTRVEDVSADGPEIPIFVFHRNYGSVKSNVIFNKEELDSLIFRFSQRAGRHISISRPLVDASLPNHDRLQLSIGSEVTTRGSTFTVRKFRETPLSPVDMIYLGTISLEMAAYFWLAVENGFNIIIAGVTASGKTTFLNSIAMYIPPSSKIVSIEDTREVNLLHQNWIPGVTRETAGRGSIDTYELLRAALRQRPEYVILGEVRGKEAHTLFQAMATGHFTLSTMHADSVDSIVKRLTKAPIEVPLMLLDSLDIVALIGPMKVGQRRIRRVHSVVEVTDVDFEHETLKTNEVFRFSPTGGFQLGNESVVLRKIREKLNLSEAEFTQEFERRVWVLTWMGEHHVTDFRTLSACFLQYNVDPDNMEQCLVNGTLPANATLPADAKLPA